MILILIDRDLKSVLIMNETHMRSLSYIIENKIKKQA